MSVCQRKLQPIAQPKTFRLQKDRAFLALRNFLIRKSTTEFIEKRK